jgi:hypothetical protein
MGGFVPRSLLPETNRKIEDSLPALPYYAGGLRVPLPSASSHAALAYILEKDPALVVVRGEKTKYLPYHEDCIERGIPDASEADLPGGNCTPQRNHNLSLVGYSAPGRRRGLQTR